MADGEQKRQTETSAFDFVYPSDFRERIRPQRPHQGIIPLPDAIDECGRALFGDEWAPQDWHARTEAEIASWNASDDRFRQSLSWPPCIARAATFQDDAAEKAAYSRKQAVYDAFLPWLNRPETSVFMLDVSGTRSVFQCSEWLRHKEFENHAFDILDSGRRSGVPLQWDIGLLGKHDPEALYLDNEQFLNFLAHINRKSKSANASSSRATEEEHRRVYMEYHKEQVGRFMQGKIKKPWASNVTEEQEIKKIRG